MMKHLHMKHTPDYTHSTLNQLEQQQQQLQQQLQLQAAIQQQYQHNNKSQNSPIVSPSAVFQLASALNNNCVEKNELSIDLMDQVKKKINFLNNIFF